MNNEFTYTCPEGHDITAPFLAAIAPNARDTRVPHTACDGAPYGSLKEARAKHPDAPDITIKVFDCLVSQARPWAWFFYVPRSDGSGVRFVSMVRSEAEAAEMARQLQSSIGEVNHA